MPVSAHGPVTDLSAKVPGLAQRTGSKVHVPFSEAIGLMAEVCRMALSAHDTPGETDQGPSSGIEMT